MRTFLKLHGSGNDFVLLDARAEALSLTTAQVIALSDRHTGIGCDQLLVLHASDSAQARMQIFNADGSEIATCGNATRCVGDFLMRESGRAEATIETLAGIRACWREESGGVRVNMGTPKLEWRDIPLAESRNTLHLGLEEGLLFDPVAVNMGNPHAIFFVRDLSAIRMGQWGPKLEHHPLFPARANISAVQVIDEAHLRLVVWERGTGLTLSCGSAACAAVVAGVRRGLCGREAQVALPGGTLSIHWESASNAVTMGGPVAYVFTGQIDLDAVAL